MARRNKRSKNRKKSLTKHHVIPSSRGGVNSDRNIIRLPRCFHEKYHALFDNMTYEEAQKLLHVIMTSRRDWTHIEIENLKTQIKEDKNGSSIGYYPHYDPDRLC